jgi:uncharacterized membrane protein YraQ (UPF0718 family)
MIVVNSILGLKKTATYVALVIVMAALCGWGYGLLVS